MPLSAGSPIIQLRDITKQFANRDGTTITVLSHVSLTVYAGEFLVIVGPSGCGKTTLLRMIQGLDIVTSGVIERGSAAGLQELAFVFQRPSLLPWRTVRRNVEFGLDLAAGRALFPEQRQKDNHINALLALTGLTDFASYLPFQISGGMQQRANLARALAVQPALLLMDEPFSALDALTREKLQEDIQRIVSATSTTVIFVTHDIREAAYLADRVVVMSSRPGQIREIVTVKESRPRSSAYHQSDRLAGHAREVSALLMDSAVNSTRPDRTEEPRPKESSPC